MTKPSQNRWSKLPELTRVILVSRAQGLTPYVIGSRLEPKSSENLHSSCSLAAVTTSPSTWSDAGSGPVNMNKVEVVVIVEV